MNLTVQGLENVMRNLQRQTDRLKGATNRGVIKAAFLIERESKKRTPVDTGNLRAGCFTTWSDAQERKSPAFKGKEAPARTNEYQAETELLRSTASAEKKFTAFVGYSAAYAIFVHENLAANHPVGEAKFLQNAVAANIQNIKETIRAEVLQNA